MSALSSNRPLKVYRCLEYEHVSIDPEDVLGEAKDLVVDSDVDGRNAFSFDFVGGHLRLRASSLVGVIPLNDHVVLRVYPRFGVANLTTMVEEVGYDRVRLKAFRDYAGHGTASDWVMDLYAETLLDYVDDILNRGLYRNYIRRDGEGSFPHGRIDFTRTVQRYAAHRVTYKASYQWFERTADTPPNRCIKAALRLIHRHLTRGKQDRGYRALLTRVAVQLAAFDDVTDDPTLRFTEDLQVAGVQAMPEARAYYRRAVDLALLIVRGQGIALEISDEGSVRLPSLLIEMNKLFEAYVCVALQKRARALRWPIDVLDGNVDGGVQLYVRPTELPVRLGAPMEPVQVRRPPDATPDIVLRMPDGTVLLVAEVKHTAKGGELPERNEVNQAVTYAIRYGLDRTLVIRPLRSGTAGLSYCGRVGTVDVFDYKFDLAAADLEQEVAKLATSMSGLLPLQATALTHSPSLD